MTDVEIADRLAWFAGDKDALDIYRRVVSVAHTWDDLIDRDKPVADSAIHAMLFDALFHLPGNPMYRRFETELRCLLYTGSVAYKAANLMQGADAHRVEIAHYLRYLVVNVGVFLISVTQGADQAPAVVAQAMPLMIPERLAEFVEEHTHAA